ncbi:hypothetical protein M0802_008477 [Mischocyttarus mexicanus]|nr:hypothetical protein M0802_008477 [Mischocyttarus mexicanus]
MKCVITGGNIKIVAKAIHALAKIGDEMYVEPQSNNLSFRSVNMANSAYADFTFFENYFSYYDFDDLEEDEALKCKISMRSAMTVFKTPNVIDKQVETCHIELKPNADFLFITLNYKNSIIKKHILPIIDCEKLQAKYVKDGDTNHLSAQSTILADAIQNFQQNLIEITLEILQQKVLLRNYIDDTSNIANTTRTQLVLFRSEFDKYSVNTETVITFCMKELRAILNFAESVKLPINIYLETAGRTCNEISLSEDEFDVMLLKEEITSIHGEFDDRENTSSDDDDDDDDSDKVRGVRRRKIRKTGHTSRQLFYEISYKTKLQRLMFKTLSLPAVFVIKNSTFETNLVLSTLNPDVDSQSETTVTGKAAKSVRRKATVKRSTKRSSKSSSKKNNTSISNRTNRYALSPQKETSCIEIMRNDDNHAYSKEHNQSEVTANVNVSTMRNVYSKPSVSSDEKKSVCGVFSNILKRKSNEGGTIDLDSVGKKSDDNDFENSVPKSPSPPSKKARFIFKKCFQTTFNLSMLPGHDIILAEDSDENSE